MWKVSYVICDVSWWNARQNSAYKAGVISANLSSLMSVLLTPVAKIVFVIYLVLVCIM